MRTRREHLHINLNLNVRGLKPSATLAINEKCRTLQQEGREVFKFGLGQSPFPVPEIVVEALRRNAHQKDYLPVKGLPQLREAVAEYNYRTQKVKTDPAGVLIGPGSKELIFLLQLVYYGDLIIPTPSWVSYSPQAHIIGRHVRWVPTREDNFWRLSYEEMEHICREDPGRPRIVILNYPSNPTGYTYPIERLKLLAQVARKYKVILVSDEIYGMIHHHDQHVSIARYYPEGTIISGGLSKWCGAGGWRLGTFSFPPDLIWLQEAMAVVASETFTSTSAPIQYAAVTAFQHHPEIDLYLHHSRRVLKAIARYMTDRFHEMGIMIPSPHGGFYMFPNFAPFREKFARQGIYNSLDMANRLLADTGMAVLPGSDFARNGDELTARMAYVDFDGQLALQAAFKTFQENTLHESFVREYCPKIVQGFDRLGNWLADL
ncbi:MAG: aminotransferase class I/II-fold pyridoxal phosphate-dependent enzyme [Bacteroidetes bacterium]|nr:MAG: aminotransferase class I/II-fold pyridoxal phosphate-dependent enzyme [Bacteroidota bacterium]